ncbi:SMI1/KNR4 family protein [Psychrobacillus sp. Sa2BUA9]|uniref:SMI1/KNR4 family protein n=2 Tax=Psychrobacillus faecigallinarum TaxID=2762235 RepID=A0ABR8R9B9_9BACI|nr:SMI1/KNR4 family protein [Psychrobacillus faecigallinarum]MBD7944122.1 SMI1/KNR4 family protein [Psychrobacillus faecigallinarum]
MNNIMFNSFQQKEDIERNLKQINLEYEKIKDYVDFEVFFFEQLGKYQVGYSFDLDGNSLITGEEGSWDDNWIVIAYESLCGDPIIIDLNEEGYPVSLLLHGLGSWGTNSFLANSMDSFINILKEIKCFLEEKELLLGKQSIKVNDVKSLLAKIIAKNNFSDYEIWESLLNPLFIIAEEHEEAMVYKVREMKTAGKKITEISSLLNIPPKNVYEYMKKN